MNAEKFTQKSLEAIKTAQDMALENNNIQIMPEHLMYALLDQEGGLIGSLFTKMGVDVNSTLAALDTVISGMPAMTGSGREPGKVYVAPETDRILTAAEKTAANMKDEYVSVEHIMLAIFDNPMQTAQNSGVKSCGVLWGFRTRQELEDNHADDIAANVKELTEIIFK